MKSSFFSYIAAVVVATTISLCVVLSSFALATTTPNTNGGPLDDLSMFKYQPKANSKSVVMAGTKARFTVLSPWVIRMEYASNDGKFEDRATLAIVNRDVPVPSFTHSMSGSTLKIVTSHITLSYDTTANGFNANSLQITSQSGDFKSAYKFGDQDTQNLLGSIRSLDDHCTIPLNCDQNKGMQTNGENLHCAWGVISKGGWTTINDTANFIMGSGEGEWFAANSRAVSNHDIYFFGHGLNYKAAVYDFSRISGRMPIPSRPLLGAWWTRWFDYDHDDLQRLLDIFRKENIPLDVLILDMNWHQKNAWTGWTWDHQLYPYPEKTLELIRKRGLMTGANIHDAQGVHDWEQNYAAFAKAMGINPASNAPINFQPLNATYMRSVEDILLYSKGNVQGAGFNFYWTDWQQGGTNGGCNGFQLNPTYITDHVRWTSMMRRGEKTRGNNFARFGGLGAHRYPVGFTGDVSSLSWECFSYQPYFSVTASNVGYNPSHDLVGPYNDHELHVRWMQFGALSGVMRIHDRGMSSGSCWNSGTCAIVDIWLLPYKYFTAIRDAMQTRVALLPYIYRESRRAYDEGLQFVHGMYYEFPSEEAAYNLVGPSGFKQAQYMFGSDISVVLVTSAADSSSELATISVWVPPGDWYDNVFGEMLTGPKTVSRQFLLADIPMLIRAGAVIPRIPHAHRQGVAASQFDEIDWYIYPGKTSGSAQLYEDDAESFGYINDEVAWTNCTYTRASRDYLAITVSAAVSDKNHQVPSARRTRFMLVGASPFDVSSVTPKCNGIDLKYDQDGGVGTWLFDGMNAQVVVDCGHVPTNAPLQFSASFISTDSVTSTQKGFASRVMLAKHLLDERQLTPGSHNAKPGFTKQAGAYAAKLQGFAATQSPSSTKWNSMIGSDYVSTVNNAIAELSGSPVPTPPPAPDMSALIQLYDAKRNDMCLCASKSCMSVNNYYQVKWTEGYQPTSNDNGVVKLNDYWSFANNDNFATTSTTPPSGYSAAAFADGYVFDFASAGTNDICLQVWQGKNDHMTLSSQKGLDYAKSNGYTQVGKCIGYTLSKPSASSKQNIWEESLLELQQEQEIVLAKDLMQRVEKKQQQQSQQQPPQMVDKKFGRFASRPDSLREHHDKNNNNNKLGEAPSKTRAIAIIKSCFH